jgi:hypothetical protein
VAGNLGVGLVASIDSQFRLVLESLSDHKFINFVNLPKIRSGGKPLIVVFKSGLVVVAHGKLLLFYDSRAILLEQMEEAFEITQIEKYYDRGARELLIVALENGNVTMIDIAKFRAFCPIETRVRDTKICAMKRTRTYVAVLGKLENETIVAPVPFGSYLTTEFSAND